MKWAVKKAKKDLERATKFQVALEDELDSNKQGLPFLRCHCLGYVMHVHSLCLPLITSHANLQFFGPRYVMHVDSLCLPFFTSHANLQFGSFSTYVEWRIRIHSRLFVNAWDTIACIWTYYWFTWRHTSNIYGWSLTRMLIFARNPTFVEKKNKVPARRVRE